MKKLLTSMFVLMLAVSFGFADDQAVQVEQKTENRGTSTQLKNRERVREHRERKEMRKEMKQARKETKEQRRDARSGK
jgi:predicted Holliday junction resolvase-like endonuclease